MEKFLWGVGPNQKYDSLLVIYYTFSNAGPPEEIVPNFEPKKPQNVNFEWFLGPNDPFRLFSHYILCPTRPMEE